MVGRHPDAAAFGVFLGEAVGDLGQRLGRRDPDRDRNPGPLLDRAAQLARMRFKRASKPARLRNASSIE